MSSRLLPNNASQLERALADASASTVSPEAIRQLWDADRCPVALLPWLAWSLSVDGWDAALDEAQQRALVRNSVALHRRKGTPWSVKHALAVVGYPDSELIEHGSYLAQWRTAGGRTLDGGWRLDGRWSLSLPGGGYLRHLALNHWAEYAIRLNLGDDGIWSRSQQRAVRQLAERYAPARAHLRGLVTKSELAFDASIALVGGSQRATIRYDRCRRLPVHRWRTVDGCWLLDGGTRPSLLDGWPIKGARRLAGTLPIGSPLDAGYAQIAVRLRSRHAFQAAGGDRISALRLRAQRTRLDGRLRLRDGRLAGGWRLSGRSRIDDTISNLGLPRLDGGWRLGRLPGVPGVWFSAIATVRRGGACYREVL